MNRTSLVFAALFVSAMAPAISSPAGCGGCAGSATLPGYGQADPPCAGTAGTVLGEWVIEVMVDASDGLCETIPAELTQGCVPHGCQNEVAYTWGAQMSAGGLDMGYVNNADPNVTRTFLEFIGYDPVIPGAYGTVVFPVGSAPTTSCGFSMDFFMTAHMCGDKLATASSFCTACGK